MNQLEVIKINKNKSITLLYSHDNGFTRYSIEIIGNNYLTRMNESPCFKTGTHEKMAKHKGFNLNEMSCVTFTK